MVELHTRGPWHFYGPGQHNVRTQKYAIDPKAPGLVAAHVIRHFVGSPAVGALRAGIAGLIRRIVGDFRLVEISSPVVSIPKHLKLLMMFHEQTVDRNILPVDDETVGAGVAGPAHARTVIGTPNPGVINNGIAAVYFEIDQGAAFAGAA